MEHLISIKVNGSTGWGAGGVTSEKMGEPEVRIEAIQAEIRESLDRARALIAESERFARDHVIIPPQADAK